MLSPLLVSQNLSLEPGRATRLVRRHIDFVAENRALDDEVPLGRDQDKMLATIASNQRDGSASIDRQCLDKFQPPVVRRQGAARETEIVATDQP